MNGKIQKVEAEIEKVKAKITAQQARLRELEQQKTELENTEIIQAIRSGKAGGSPVALSAEKEDLEDEE